MPSHDMFCTSSCICAEPHACILSKLTYTCTDALSFAAGKHAISAKHAVVLHSIPRSNKVKIEHLQLCHDSHVGDAMYVVYTCWQCNCVQAHQQPCTAWQQVYHAQMSMWKCQKHTGLLGCFGPSLIQKLCTSCICRFMWGRGLLQKPQLQPCQLASTAKPLLMAHRYSMRDCGFEQLSHSWSCMQSHHEHIFFGSQEAAECPIGHHAVCMTPCSKLCTVYTARGVSMLSCKAF